MLVQAHTVMNFYNWLYAPPAAPWVWEISESLTSELSCAMNMYSHILVLIASGLMHMVK